MKLCLKRGLCGTEYLSPVLISTTIRPDSNWNGYRLIRISTWFIADEKKKPYAVEFPEPFSRGERLAVDFRIINGESVARIRQEASLLGRQEHSGNLAHQQRISLKRKYADFSSSRDTQLDYIRRCLWDRRIDPSPLVADPKALFKVEHLGPERLLLER